MQVLPSTLQDIVQTPIHSTGNFSPDDAFATVFASYIEEGRDTYTGVPEGFSAYDQGSGTVSRDVVEELKDELEKYDAHDASYAALEALLASGEPLTISRLLGTLSGNGRLTGKMDSDEADSFTSLMQKMGFSKDERSELLEMADSGKNFALWQRISQKMGQMEGDGLSMNGKEFSALLRGLDISDQARKQMEKVFAEQNASEGMLSKEKLRALLAGAEAEVTERDVAARTIEKHARTAVLDAIQAEKMKKMGSQDADNRGTAQSDASKRRMQLHADKEAEEKGFLSKTADKFADKADSPEMADKDGDKDPFDTSKEGKSRAERILGKSKRDDDTFAVDGKKQPDAVQDAMDKVSVSGMFQSADSPEHLHSSRRDAAAVAREFRQEIFSQVEQGILQSTANGQKQLTLHLNPEALGQVTLVLSMHEGELRATLKTENGATAEVLQEQMAELKTALEEQGIKVAEIDVESNVAEDSSDYLWNGQAEQNFGQEAQEKALLSRLAQLRKQASADNPATLETPEPRKTSEAGLHIVA